MLFWIRVMIMPRQARKLAESGIYHVMLRGIDRQLIFEEAEDYLRFLSLLQECRGLCGFELYAYCLMGNHLHLLLKVGDEKLETVFKRLAGRYVYWYNIKYQRTGHLFQDRFRSEPVEDDTYFLTVLRYIHQNPVKAKLCRHPEDYSYSSYCDYLAESDHIDFAYALGMISSDEFVRYSCEENDDKCLEISEKPRCAVTDEQAKAIIEKISKCRTIVEFQSLEEPKKQKYVQKIHEKGLSLRQISRLTGTSKGMVEKYVKE